MSFYQSIILGLAISVTLYLVDGICKKKKIKQSDLVVKLTAQGVHQTFHKQ